MQASTTSQISSIVSCLKINEPLKNHTTFKIGGPAKYFAEINTRAELFKLRNFCYKSNLRFLVLGAGSNVLISDHGFDGVAARLQGEFNDYVFDKEILSAGAGDSLAVLVKKACDKGLSGMEALAGIPGTLGGAIMGNAGTNDCWIGGLAGRIEVLSDSCLSMFLDKKELEFGYRSSNLEGRVILSAVLHLKKGRKNDILKSINALMSRRSETQPLASYNAGCIFKNPAGKSAGRLIDEAGLKGLVFGSAKVSEKHANFIINTGNASASDVRSLITIIHQKVKEKSGIDLELELKVIG